MEHWRRLSRKESEVAICVTSGCRNYGHFLLESYRSGIILCGHCHAEHMLKLEEVGEVEHKKNQLRDELKFGVCIGGPIGGQVRSAIGLSFQVKFVRKSGFVDKELFPRKSENKHGRTITEAYAVYHYDQLEFVLNSNKPIGLWIYSAVDRSESVMKLFRAYSSEAIEDLP